MNDFAVKRAAPLRPEEFGSQTGELVSAAPCHPGHTTITVCMGVRDKVQRDWVAAGYQFGARLAGVVVFDDELDVLVPWPIWPRRITIDGRIVSSDPFGALDSFPVDRGVVRY